MNQSIIFLIIFITLLAWYASFQRLVRQKGFDPSLITFADPLLLKSFWGYRWGLFAGGLSKLLSLVFLSHLVFYVLIASAIIHLLIIFVFGRQQTQPISYYVLTVVAAGGVLLAGSWLFFIAAIVIQEALLVRWRKIQKQRYDRWVMRLAGQIDQQFKSIATNLPARDWRWVLHIAVTESIARPAIVRQAERLYFCVRKPPIISTGIMQIRDTQPMSDKESMRRGARIVADVLAHMPKNLSHSQQLAWLAAHYNGSNNYTHYLQATDSGIRQFFRINN